MDPDVISTSRVVQSTLTVDDVIDDVGFVFDDVIDDVGVVLDDVINDVGFVLDDLTDCLFFISFIFSTSNYASPTA